MEDSVTLTLHTSRRYAATVFFGCMVFVATGIWMLTVGEDAFTAWGCIVFFGGGSLLFVRAAFDPRPQLVIDDSGLRDRTLAVGTIPWEQVAEARLETTYGVPLLCLKLQRPEEVLARTSRGRRILQAANRSVGFGDVCISLSGLSADPMEILEEIDRRVQVSS